MSRRSYQQYCGLAESLDLLGERWTLLIVRDLLTGPKRYTDLHARLTGIGTGLLSERLRDLESAGVIQKAVLPPPAASTVYELTQSGEELRPMLFGLIRWGSKRLGEPGENQAIDAESFALALGARLESKLTGINGLFEFNVDGRPIRLHINDGRITVAASQTASPLATITTDTATLVALNAGTRSLSDALARGDIAGAGDPEAIGALITAFAE
ncbi:HxlR family transcriptional regulator [Mycobacteroides abscessus subsp. massiliense]|nr:HxlR family transcriptional regulator [Mycobacteroides abscessus subsp. massiliense]SKU11801.1 HxlR family transcriptional regulator [Mycobacteroides abscessus subsp. massiliense]